MVSRIQNQKRLFLKALELGTRENIIARGSALKGMWLISVDNNLIGATEAIEIENLLNQHSDIFRKQ